MEYCFNAYHLVGAAIVGFLGGLYLLGHWRGFARVCGSAQFMVDWVAAAQRFITGG